MSAIAQGLAAVGNALLLLCTFLIEMVTFRVSRLLRWLVLPSEEARLLSALREADNYPDWHKTALALDQLLGNDAWKTNSASRSYDFRLLLARYNEISMARLAATTPEGVNRLADILRSGLIRNIGGLNEPQLFRKTYTGTKSLIEAYTDQVILALRKMVSTPDLDQSRKLEFFRDARQAYGSSALILHGGPTFALYHLGVIRTLHEQGLLPRVICGNSVGALIAALVCIHTDDHLFDVLTPEGIDLSVFQSDRATGTMKRKIIRLFKYGHLLDMRVLEECVQANVGDLTFEEAYQRTNRILNITIQPSRQHRLPQILNYYTAPNVLIRTAACASTALVGIFESVSLLAKDRDGRIVPWMDSHVNWGPSSNAESFKESPMTRMSELFNVNHFIVSQANPLVAPFLPATAPSSSYWLTPVQKLKSLLAMELRHRMQQLDRLHLLPSALHILTEEMLSGNITLSPKLSLNDLPKAVSNPDHSSVSQWMLRGEQATWPFLSLIRNRCAIELALDKGYLRVQQSDRTQNPSMALGRQESDVVAKKITKRTKSIH